MSKMETLLNVTILLFSYEENVDFNPIMSNIVVTDKANCRLPCLLGEGGY
jgi:hypothetical protein